MSGARAIPVLILGLLMTMGLSSIATETSEPTPKSGHECEKFLDDPRMTTLPLFGGDVSLPKDFEAGGRFLQRVEPPTFMRSEQALQEPDLQPGDLGDQGGEDAIALERRHTDYSYMDEEWTGGICLEGVNGSPNGYICICDATFVLTNETGLDPLRPIRTIDSNYLWFDNITMYGGAVDLRSTDHTITSNSLFIDSNGVVASTSNDGYVHNISVIVQRPPTNLVHHPPETLPGVPHGRDFMCWPHVEPPPCEGGGVFLSGGEDWVVEWSYFHGAGGAGTTTSAMDITLRHNTFRDTVLGVSAGVNEIAWNLIRGNHESGTNVFGFANNQDRTDYHNNSFIMPMKFDHGLIIRAKPGAWVENCEACDLAHNDFIGYGMPDRDSSGRYAALFSDGENSIIANDNYWGTMHDPRVPECWWICTSEDTTLVLDRWETEPIHDITPIMYTLDHRDVPYWAERITGLPIQDAWDDLPLPDA